jgi:small multidrug resistance family-3 protein
MPLRLIAVSALLFLVAGLMEIGGGYLVWLWLRENRGWVLGVLGGVILFLYGVIPTFQRTLRPRIRRLRGHLRCAFHPLGLVAGWGPPRPT